MKQAGQKESAAVGRNAVFAVAPVTVVASTRKWQESYHQEQATIRKHQFVIQASDDA